MKLDVESLRTLQMVVTTGTFTEAASRLGISQSAVSWKIKRLEERVGLELVNRGSEIEATAHGNDLLHYAERIVDAHDSAVEHLSRSDLQGLVRLGTNEDLRGGELAEVLARFARRYPQIQLHVRVELSGTVREWLEDGEIDLALLQIPVADKRDGDVELWREPMHWMQAKEMPTPELDNNPNEGHSGGSAKDQTKNGTSGKAADGVAQLVSFGPGLAYLDHAEAALEAAGIEWRTVLECPMLSGVQAAVESGLGVAALNTRNCTDGMTPWPVDAPLPELCEVIRADESANPEVLEALRDALTTALDVVR